MVRNIRIYKSNYPIKSKQLFIDNDKIIDIYSFQNEDGIVLNDKIVIIEIFVSNLRKKCHTVGKEKLGEVEKYILGFVEEDNNFSMIIGGEQ